MAIDYSALKSEIIIPKIEEYGKTVYIRRAGSATGYTKAFDKVQSRYYWYLTSDPTQITYTDPASSYTNIEGHAIEAKYEQSEIDGVTVLANDRRFKIADISGITSSDKLVVDSMILNIITVSPTQPGTITLLYVLQCRGGS